jgi:hypothetical protein
MAPPGCGGGCGGATRPRTRPTKLDRARGGCWGSSRTTCCSSCSGSCPRWSSARSPAAPPGSAAWCAVRRAREIGVRGGVVTPRGPPPLGVFFFFLRHLHAVYIALCSMNPLAERAARPLVPSGSPGPWLRGPPAPQVASPAIWAAEFARSYPAAQPPAALPPLTQAGGRGGGGGGGEGEGGGAEYEAWRDEGGGRGAAGAAAPAGSAAPSPPSPARRPAAAEGEGGWSCRRACIERVRLPGTLSHGP